MAVSFILLITFFTRLGLASINDALNLIACSLASFKFPDQVLYTLGHVADNIQIQDVVIRANFVELCGLLSKEIVCVELFNFKTFFNCQPSV